MMRSIQSRTRRRHGRKCIAEAEGNESDDVQGHMPRLRSAMGEGNETDDDDVQGHIRRDTSPPPNATRPTRTGRATTGGDSVGAERDETDDVEGHGRQEYGADAARDEADDVEGHGPVIPKLPVRRRSDHDARGLRPRSAWFVMLPVRNTAVAR